MLSYEVKVDPRRVETAAAENLRVWLILLTIISRLKSLVVWNGAASSRRRSSCALSDKLGVEQALEF